MDDAYACFLTEDVKGAAIQNGQPRFGQMPVRDDHSVERQTQVKQSKRNESFFLLPYLGFIENCFRVVVSDR